eukprot:1807066-Prymnesium_polylepis.1
MFYMYKPHKQRKATHSESEAARPRVQNRAPYIPTKGKNTPFSPRGGGRGRRSGDLPLYVDAVRKGPPGALTRKASDARAAPLTQPLAPTPVKSRMAAGFKSPPGASL